MPTAPGIDASRECPLVRRQTGGGAILHDRELTYSLAVPAGYPRASDAAWLYSIIHKAIARTLASYGVDARVSAAPQGPETRQPFLCFQRRGACDVLVDDSKIAGSARRRSRGAVLQHGSLLLVRSTARPELPGILELTGSSPPPAELGERLAQELSCDLRLSLERQGLSAAEGQAAAGAGRTKIRRASVDSAALAVQAFACLPTARRPIEPAASEIREPLQCAKLRLRARLACPASSR